MRFHLGPIPSSPDFQPDESWNSLNEFSPWAMQAAALSLGLAFTIFLATLWWAFTPLGELDLSFSELFFLILGQIVVHELIHAFASPKCGRSHNTVVGFWPSKLLFYAHYSGELTRNRFLVILLLPFIIISLVPLLFSFLLQTACSWIAFLSVFNGLASCLDIYGAGMILAQIPRNAVIRNQGWKTYWKSADENVPKTGFSATWHKAFLSLLLPMLLISLIYIEEDLRGWWDWQNVKATSEHEGENFDYASVVPPPVPDQLNFALNPVVASCYAEWLDKRGHKIEPPNTNVINQLAMSILREHDYSMWPRIGVWSKGTLTNLKDWQAYYRASYTNLEGVVTNEFPTTPKQHTAAEDVLIALSKYDWAIEKLRQASKLPYSRFPLDYAKDHPFDELLPHLASEKHWLQVLEFRAIAELDLGQSQKALNDVELALFLINSLHDEPILISQLVRAAQTQITLQIIFEGLAKHRWSNAQLVAIQEELGKLDFLADYQFAMRGERNFALARIEYLGRRRNFTDFSGWRFDDDENIVSMSMDRLTYWVGAAFFHSLPKGWFDLAEADVANMHRQWSLRAANVHQHQVFPKIVSGATAYVRHSPLKPWDLLSRIMVPDQEIPVLKFAYEQSSVDMALIGCALERYRLAKMEYPKSLDELAPHFITQLPHDVVGGKPLKYRRQNKETFVLYSIGWNETDDGGKVVLDEDDSVDIKKGDWVWHYPDAH